MKLFNNSKKTAEPLMLSGPNEWSFKEVDITKLHKWPKYAEDPEDVRETKLRQTFMKCAQINKIEAFKAGVLAKMPLDVVTEKEFTLLQNAIFYGSREVVDHLLEIGANPAHRSGPRGYDALCVAAIAGQYDMAMKLLAHSSKKADPETTDHLGQSILQIAILNHQFDFAKKWMENQNPNLQHTDKADRNALATTLGIYFLISFKDLESPDTKILDENLLKLQEFCLYMLAKMNAFEKIEGVNKTPGQVVLHSHLAWNAGPGQRDLTTNAQQAVERLYLNAFPVAKMLYDQAKVNSGADGAGKYMMLFDQFDKDFKANKKREAENAAAMEK